MEAAGEVGEHPHDLKTHASNTAYALSFQDFHRGADDSPLNGILNGMSATDDRGHVPLRRYSAANRRPSARTEEQAERAAARRTHPEQHVDAPTTVSIPSRNLRATPMRAARASATSAAGQTGAHGRRRRRRTAYVATSQYRAEVEVRHADASSDDGSSSSDGDFASISPSTSPHASHMQLPATASVQRGSSSAEHIAPPVHEHRPHRQYYPPNYNVAAVPLPAPTPRITSAPANPLVQTKYVADGYAVQLVDSFPGLAALLRRVRGESVVACDMEGVRLGRHPGRACLLQIALDPRRHPDVPIFVVDLEVLGPGAFAFTAHRYSLGALFASQEVTKLFYDPRADADALWSHYRLMPQHVLCVQLMDLAHRHRHDPEELAHPHARVRNLQAALQEHVLDARDVEHLDFLKQQVQVIGYDKFAERPLQPLLLEYAASGVASLFKLYRALLGEGPQAALAEAAAADVCAVRARSASAPARPRETEGASGVTAADVHKVLQHSLQRVKACLEASVEPWETRAWAPF